MNQNKEPAQSATNPPPQEKTEGPQNTPSRNPVGILSTKISRFASATSPTRPRTVTLGQIYHAIQYGGKHTDRVESIRRTFRNTPGSKAAKRMAVAESKKKLPVITVAGTFERRANNA